MDDDMFRLDRNGGQDKITKAMYSPKAYRRRGDSERPLSPTKKACVWVIIMLIIFGLGYLVDQRTVGGHVSPKSIRSVAEN